MENLKLTPDQGQALFSKFEFHFRQKFLEIISKKEIPLLLKKSFFELNETEKSILAVYSIYKGDGIIYPESIPSIFRVIEYSFKKRCKLDLDKIEGIIRKKEFENKKLTGLDKAIFAINLIVQFAEKNKININF